MMLGKETQEEKQFAILLVFSSVDAQCQLVRKAAEQLGSLVHVAFTEKELATSFDQNHQDVVLVDTRHPDQLDPQHCARYLRSSENNDDNILVALRVPNESNDNDPVEMSNLLSCGFDRQLVVTSNRDTYVSELMCLQQHRKTLLQRRCRLQLLKAVVDNCNDAVQITDSSHQILYVNQSFERLSGYSSTDIIGRTVSDLFNMNNDVISNQLTNGKPWSGVCHLKRKNGEKLPQNCKMLPIFNSKNKIVNYISIRNPVEEKEKLYHQNTVSTLENTTESVRRTRSRKESVARMTSMTIEAPITKVIGQIMKLHEATSGSVALALDAILDGLRSSELYAPYLTPKVREDKFTSELVGGLITMDEDIWNHRRVSVVKRSSYPTEHLAVKPFVNLASILLESSTEICDLLESETKWDFDIFKLERLTQHRPLSHLASRTFQRFEVSDFLEVNDDAILAWLMMIENNYHQANAYHNSTHAADVMHATAYFLSCPQIKDLFDHVDEVAALIAAVVHDLDHPGRTNSFLVNSNAQLALLYNDLAVLECHHASKAFQLTLKNPNCNIFKNLSRENFKILRQQIVDMVLATEMTKHFEHLNKFVSVVNQVDLQDSSDPEGSTEALSKLSTIENLTLVKRMLIKCADISNPARPLPLCKQWAVRIAKEYCIQTDEEKKQGLPVVMPIFNSAACNLPKTQISFMDLFINDMFDAWTSFCGANELANTIKENYGYWKEMEAAEEHILKF